MSETVIRQRSTVDLDAFERDMRDTERYHHDDPLAELARLVGEEHDPYGDVFAREAQAPAGGSAHRHAEHAAAPGRADHDEHDFHAAQGMSPRLSGDFAAIEAGLRGTVPPPGPYDLPAGAQNYEPGHDDGYGVGPMSEGQWQQPAREVPRSRRPMALIAATIAVGVIGVGTAFALKGHISTSPREVKTILADGSPTKVQPPADASADAQAGQDAAVLGKSQPSPTALATREEQPVDLLQAARDNAAAQARSDAASVPVPPSPGQLATGGGAFPMADMPAPKRVKVVAVRPDGTILPGGSTTAPVDAATPSANAAPRAPSGKTSDRAGPVAKPSTPKTVAVKTTSRVAAPKSIDQLAEGGTDPVAAPATPAAKKPKPQRVASADTGEKDATQTVSPEPEASGAGGFAVQLAAPGSEADARSTSSRLSKKFAGPLGGHHLAFHKADSNGKPVYRVRVSSLSRSDAVSLCEKLKADGGSCFVAKN